MTWCNNPDDDRALQLVTAAATKEPSVTVATTAVVLDSKTHEISTIICPSCGYNLPYQDQVHILIRIYSIVLFCWLYIPYQFHILIYPWGQVGIHDLPGLPAGVKFDPTDQEILEHLEAKVISDMRKLHRLIDEFIPTLEGENGICYTHPERLPGTLML